MQILSKVIKRVQNFSILIIMENLSEGKKLGFIIFSNFDSNFNEKFK